jgi:hypothetical protein
MFFARRKLCWLVLLIAGDIAALASPVQAETPAGVPLRVGAE